MILEEFVTIELAEQGELLKMLLEFVRQGFEYSEGQS